MALDKEALKSGIKAAMLANISNVTAQQSGEIDTLAASFANTIDSYVKGMTITYTAGLIAPSGGGPVTGTLTYTIS